jgi:hypothetical protein
MESELNKKLVKTILSQIPKNRKTVLYLVNTLNISRESAYRRIRGDIPFTVEELITLAIDLEFSIDAIYDREKQSHAFHDFTRTANLSGDFFLEMLKKYDELLEKINYAKKVESIMAFNSFPPPFYAGFPDLFKFTYYKWLYQENEISRNDPYSGIVLPNEAIVYQKNIWENMYRGKSMTLILDMNIFLNLIKEIHYFHQRKLLTDEELLSLKEETLHLIEQYEKTAQTGTFGTINAQLYLSPLCVNSNTICYNCDEDLEPLFWIFTINPVIIQNTEFSSMQTKWLNSLRRQSALITQSNEIMQAEFFFQQREYVDKYLSTDNS